MAQWQHLAADLGHSASGHWVVLVPLAFELAALDRSGNFGPGMSEVARCLVESEVLWWGASRGAVLQVVECRAASLQAASPAVSREVVA